MKKYLMGLFGLIVAFNANAEGVILSDTSVEEESIEAPVNNSYNQKNERRQISPAIRNILSNDTSDPLFLVGDNQFLSDTSIYSADEKIRLGQYIGYGINPNFAVHANMLYQIDFSGEDQNGFGATEFGGTYRMNHGTGDWHIKSDVLFGLKLWGSSRVRSPEYADSSYYAGMRFGRQYTGITLAGTVKSTWVFDEGRGLSYIDFIPEAYFRFKYDWRAGIGFDFRKSTNTRLLSNQEWLNFKLLRQYGNTQYIGKIDYELEDHELQLGFNIKILF